MFYTWCSSVQRRWQGQWFSASLWPLAAIPEAALLIWVLVFTAVLQSIQGCAISSSLHVVVFGMLNQTGIGAQFLGCVKGLSPISAQENSCYKGVPAVLELCGSLFVWALFYRNLWQCKCCYFLKRCSCTKKSTFCGLCLLWVTSTGQAKYLCK